MVWQGFVSINLRIALGAFLKIKNQGEKTLALGYFISGIVGGVTEPVLDGILSKYVGR